MVLGGGPWYDLVMVLIWLWYDMMIDDDDDDNIDEYDSPKLLLAVAMGAQEFYTRSSARAWNAVGGWDWCCCTIPHLAFHL